MRAHDQGGHASSACTKIVLRNGVAGPVTHLVARSAETTNKRRATNNPQTLKAARTFTGDNDLWCWMVRAGQDTFESGRWLCRCRLDYQRCAQHQTATGDGKPGPDHKSCAHEVRIFVQTGFCTTKWNGARLSQPQHARQPKTRGIAYAHSTIRAAAGGTPALQRWRTSRKRYSPIPHGIELVVSDCRPNTFIAGNGWPVASNSEFASGPRQRLVAPEM